MAERTASEPKPFTPQEQERRARAAHTQVVAIADSLERMTCPGRVPFGDCPLCAAVKAVEELGSALARLT